MGKLSRLIRATGLALSNSQIDMCLRVDNLWKFVLAEGNADSQISALTLNSIKMGIYACRACAQNARARFAQGFKTCSKP